LSTSLLNDAFAHHVWATVRLIDACRPLTPAQLATSVPGTYLDRVSKRWDDALNRLRTFVED
jgi:hypothetical protein